jgi:serine/threonine protein kinase
MTLLKSSAGSTAFPLLNQPSAATTQDFSSLQISSKAIEDPSVLSKLEDYLIVRHLGSGAYANVKLAQHKKTKLKVAIKIYPKYKLNDATKRKAVQREIMCMKRLDHANIVKLHENFETAKDIYLV